MTSFAIHEPTLFDEHSEPAFRAVFGGLLQRSTTVDVALDRIRLTSIDFAESDLRRLRRLRLLLRELNAVTLDAEAQAILTDRSRAAPLIRLSRMLEDGVIEVRASPMGAWSPSFSVFGDEAGPHTVLLGAHWFRTPLPLGGPSFASLHGSEGARLAATRFEGAWKRAHAVRPAVQGILKRVRSLRQTRGSDS